MFTWVPLLQVTDGACATVTVLVVGSMNGSARRLMLPKLHCGGSVAFVWLVMLRRRSLWSQTMSSRKLPDWPVPTVAVLGQAMSTMAPLFTGLPVVGSSQL